MLTTSARLLRLLGLLQSRPMWSSAELAERLEITDRSVRRDVERLRELGYPVHASPGVGGGYRLGAGRALPPLLLDDEEAVAVAVSLRTAAGGTVTGVGESSVRALAKLEQVLPARLRAQVSALQAATEPMAAGTPPVDAASLVTLANACRDHERVRFDYVTHRGAQAERRAEPHRLVSTGRRWYLVARDVDRADWRSFRIDRMGTVVSTGLRFTPMDPPEDAVAFVSHGVSSAPYRYQARLRLHLPMEAAAERVPPSTGVLVPLDSDTCELTTGANSIEALAFEALILGCEFEVLEPAELSDAVRALGGRLMRGAGG